MSTYKIGMYIKELLYQQGKTQVELAKYMGISKQVLSNNLRGANNLSVEKLIMISEFLNTPVERIIRKNMKIICFQKSYAKFNVSKVENYEYPIGLDGYGKSVIDYMNEEQKELFLYLFNNEIFPRDAFTRFKICAYAIRNSLVEFLMDHLEKEKMFETNEITSLYYKSLFPNLKTTGKILGDVETKDTMMNYYTFAERDYIYSVMNCMDIRILDLIPNPSKRIYKKRNKGNRKNETIVEIKEPQIKRDNYNIFMKIAIDTDNLFILDYFTKRYDYKFGKRHLSYAYRFESEECIKFISKNMKTELKS